MDSLYNVPNSILNHVQPSSDGGIFKVILENIAIEDNSNGTQNSTAGNNTVASSTLSSIKTRLLTGNYGIMFGLGITLSILLIFFSSLFWIMYCTRKSDVKAQRIIKMVLQRGRKHRVQNPHWAWLATQFIILMFVLLLVCVFTILALVSIIKFHNSVFDSPNSNDNDAGLFIKLSTALNDANDFLSNFAERSKRDGSATLDKIIHATEVMQNETMAKFNPILFNDLGVTATFAAGEKMVKTIELMFDTFEDINSNFLKLTAIVNNIKQKASLVNYTLNEYWECSNNSACNQTLADIKQKGQKLMHTKWQKNLDSGQLIRPATSFIGVMAGRKKTKAVVRSEMEFGKKQSDDQIIKTYIRMKKELDIPGSIRNMTNEIWTKSGHQLEENADKVRNISHLISTQVQPVAKRYIGWITFLSVIATFIIFCGIVGAGFVIIKSYTHSSRNHSTAPLSDVNRNRSKVCIYIYLLFLVYVLYFILALFLIGGYLETEACRYLDPQKQIIDNNGTLIIDSLTNSFLDKNWMTIEKIMPKQDIPIPKPENVLGGIINQCKNNDGLFTSLHVIDRIDPEVLNKPELAARFTRIGKRLMIDQLNETDPEKMMPPNLKEDLAQSGALDDFLIVEEKYDILFDLMHTSILTTSPSVIMQDLRNLESNYSMKNVDQRVYTLLSALEAATAPLKLQIQILNDSIYRVETIPKIAPIVKNMNHSLTTMNALMKDKPRVFELAEKLFDREISATTPEKAKEVMAKFGPSMLAEVGRCRSLHSTFIALESGVCRDTLGPLNAIWLTLGWCLIFITPMSFICLYLLIKKTAIFEKPIPLDEVRTSLIQKPVSA